MSGGATGAKCCETAPSSDARGGRNFKPPPSIGDGIKIILSSSVD